MRFRQAARFAHRRSTGYWHRASGPGYKDRLTNANRRARALGAGGGERAGMCRIEATHDRTFHRNAVKRKKLNHTNYGNGDPMGRPPFPQGNNAQTQLCRAWPREVKCRTQRNPFKLHGAPRRRLGLLSRRSRLEKGPLLECGDLSPFFSSGHNLQTPHSGSHMNHPRVLLSVPVILTARKRRY